MECAPPASRSPDNNLHGPALRPYCDRHHSHSSVTTGEPDECTRTRHPDRRGGDHRLRPRDRRPRHRYGCAGAAAALEADAAGADVVLLERQSGGGGSSALSGGEMYLGGGTPIQEACGFTDTAEEMEKFLLAALGPDADQAKVDSTAARASPTTSGSSTTASPSSRHCGTPPPGCRPPTTA
ncbi:FAD-binding protein [Rhodococcus hoagii]|nr:FAD-binding protein [Prescottella equi]